MRSGISTAIFLAGATFLSFATAASAQTVRMPSSIPFASDAKVRQAVKDQCQLQTRIPQYIAEFAGQVELADDPGRSGRVLDMKIDEVRTAGGGLYSGSKWINVSGVLRENGKQIADFKGRRSTIGYFNFTACSAAARCARALGKDIAGWLENPRPNTVLGTD